jgi:beta-glucosidase
MVLQDSKQAAEIAINAGSDMDMESSAYVDHWPLVQEGKVESIIDDAARRVLKVKFELGLFDDPINTVMKIAKQWENSNFKKVF